MSCLHAILTAAGFVLHTGALVADWVIDGHYPLFSLREALSFLAWALVALYCLVIYRYRAQAVGAFTMPLISVLTLVAQCPGDFFCDLVVPDSHDSLDLCLCGFRYCLYGQRDVLTPGARTQTQD